MQGIEMFKNLNSYDNKKGKSKFNLIFDVHKASKVWILMSYDAQHSLLF